jgi:hypothetical protein
VSDEPKKWEHVAGVSYPNPVTESIDVEYSYQLESEAPVSPPKRIRIRHPKCILSEPIDYKALELAYKKCRWRWHDGWATEARLKELVESFSREVVSGDSHYLSSGGVTCELVDGKVIVSVDHKLFEAMPPTKDCVEGGSK